MNPRLTLVPILLLAVACGGHPSSPSVAPRAGEPASERRDPQRTASRDSASHAPMLPPAPVLDTLVPPSELAAELRLAADSAADEEVLEALAEARPEDDAEDAGLEVANGGGAKALTGTVSWDIDVDTYNSHDRVQYYLDFFLGKGRERMGIWLSRMPRYEPMIRERLQAARACRATWSIWP